MKSDVTTRGRRGPEPIDASVTPPVPPRDLEVAQFDALDGEMIVLAFPIDEASPRDALTPAEHAVVAAIEAGKTNAQIARERGTSTRTVANQVASLFRKLNVGSRAELVATCAVLRDGTSGAR